MPKDIATLVDPERSIFDKAVGKSAAAQGVGHRYVCAAVFGDSNSHNSVYSDGADPNGIAPPPWFSSSALTSNFWRAWGWESWIGPLSMQRAQVVKSWAVQGNGILCPGSSPAGWPLSRQIDLALADPAWAKINRAIILIGTNDALQGTTTPSTVDQCAAALLTQIARLNVPVDLISTPPNAATTVVGGGMQVWAWLVQWRAKLKQIADASKGRIRFIDAYSLGNTPLTSPDGFAAGMSLADAIHTNNAYAFKIADAWVSATFPSSLAGDLDIWPHAAYAGSGGSNGQIDQGFVNPIMTTAGGTGTGTGTIARFLTIANNGGASHNGSVATSTIPGGVGNMQSLAITSAGSGDSVDVTGQEVLGSAAGFLADGDAAFMQALVRINAGGIYPRNVSLRLSGYKNPTTVAAQCFEPGTTNGREVALPLAGTRTMLLRTPLLVSPTGGFGTITPRLHVEFAGAGSCTVDIGNFEVRRLRAGSF